MANFQLRLDHKDLERLLGVPAKGEAIEPHSVFLQFSNAVIQQFAGRHLKTLINSEAIQEVEHELKLEVAKVVEEAIRVYDPETKVSSLRPRINDMINLSVDLIITHLVLDKTRERLAVLDVPAMIDAAVETHVKDEVILALRRRTQSEYMSVVEAEQRVLAGGNLDDFVAQDSLRQIYGAGMRPSKGG